MLTVDQHMRAQAFRNAIGQRDDPWHQDHGPVFIGIDWAKPETRKEQALQRKISRKLKKRNKRLAA